MFKGQKTGQSGWNTESRVMAKVKLKRGAAPDPAGPCNLEKPVFDEKPLYFSSYTQLLDSS